MKILLATGGSRGDVQPMLALALALQGAGHDVLMAGPPERAGWASALGCPYEPVGIDATALIDSMDNAHTLRAAAVFTGYLKGEIRRQFSCLPALAAGRDLVIGASLCFALSSVAERWRIPYRFIAFTPQLLPSGEHPFIAFRRQRRPAWCNRLGWQAVRFADRWHMNVLINRYRRRLGLAGVSDWFGHVMGPMLIVASDRAIAPLPADTNRPAIQTGYMHLAQPPQQMPGLSRFLASGSAPVYVGFGSMPRPDQERLLPMVIEAGRRAGQRLVVARFWERRTGTDGGGQVFFIRRFPHAQLFPRMAAIVHHGGAGTTATAAASGVPQIIVPHILDQYYWAERVRRLGLGPAPVWRARLDAPALAGAIGQCVSRPGYRRAAQAVAGRIRSGGGIGDTVRAILSGLSGRPTPLTAP